MSVDQLRFDVAKENLSYVENMISKIQIGNKVLLGDSGKEGFLEEAQLASNDMKTIELEGESRTLDVKDYDDFFNRMRKVVSDEDSYRKELKKNLELRTEEEIEKLKNSEYKYMNKINFKLWPWVIVSFILGLGVIFLVMFVIWYFSNGDSQNSNTSNLYNDVFCGGCKKESADDI